MAGFLKGASYGLKSAEDVWKGVFMKKKIYILGLLAAAIAALAGCGRNKNGSDTGQTVSAKDYVYKVEELSFSTEENNISSLMKAGDKIYAYGYHYNGENNTAKIELLSLNTDGSLKEKNEIVLKENESMNSLIPDGQGNIYAVKNIYNSEPEGEGNYQDLYYLVKLTEKGEEVFSVELNTMPELDEINTEDYFYTGNILFKDDFVYVSIIGNYVKFDKDGNFQKILKNSEGNSLEGVNLYVLESGKVAALTYEEDGVYIAHVDLESGAFSDKAKVPGSSYEYSVYTGVGYDLYLVNSYGVYGYNVGAEDKTQLMSYIDSDLGVYTVYNVIPVNEKEFLATYDDMENYMTKVGKFTKVEPKDVKDKTVLTLACAGMDWDIRGAVVKFNKSNENYRITIQDYSSLYGTENDYMAGINRLNADIVSGKVPDILVVNSNIPFESYVSKGMIEDIKPYIEKDEELDINQYMPNIMEAYSVEGKLYSLVPYYMISTIVAKASDVGEERGWTVQEAMDLLATKPEGTQLLNYATRDSMLINSMTIAGNQFIDWDTGKCNFDSDSFMQLLEFLKQFPEELNDEDLDAYWQNYDSMWREGRVIAQMASISGFRDYNYMEKGTFGEKITIIGFPSSNEDGSAIIAGMQLAMSSKSSNKEGVWEFLRYFLTDEYQNEVNGGLPLSIRRLDELAAEAMKNPTYIDENGNEVETTDTFYLNGIEIPIEPMTEEEVESLKKELYSFTQTYSYNENLIQIVQEETAAFFSGQKSAKEVAGIIQSRAQIYVNENR